MDININCEWQNSTINSKLRICKHCHFVSSVDDETAYSRVCPVLIDMAAHNPAYKQIKLNKISTLKADGTSVEQIIDQKSVDASSRFGEWWFGGLNDKELANISHTQAAQMNLMNRMNMSHTPPQVSTQESNSKPCTQEQIDSRLEICKGCEFYKNNSCLKCGCSLSRDRNYMNKLYWADKSCPIGKWGPVE